MLSSLLLCNSQSTWQSEANSSKDFYSRAMCVSLSLSMLEAQWEFAPSFMITGFTTDTASCLPFIISSLSIPWMLIRTLTLWLYTYTLARKHARTHMRHINSTFCHRLHAYYIRVWRGAFSFYSFFFVCYVWLILMIVWCKTSAQKAGMNILACPTMCVQLKSWERVLDFLSHIQIASSCNIILSAVYSCVYLQKVF